MNKYEIMADQIIDILEINTRYVNIETLKKEIIKLIKDKVDNPFEFCKYSEIQITCIEDTISEILKGTYKKEDDYDYFID